MKVLVLAMAIASLCAANMYAAEGAIPVKISLIPTIGIPAGQVVHGLDLGIIGDRVTEIQGVQLSWIYGGVTEKMVGVQAGFVLISNNVKGLQYGFYNQAQNVEGLQFGFVNSADTMKGVQIGLVNIIKQGRLPFMVIVNGNW
jgi:hypothetical protein